MNLYTEARSIAAEALRESRGYGGEPHDFIPELCDSRDIVIYYHKAIQFCAEHNTDDGESFLEDCGGIAQPGDTFGMIACRIAFATLYCAALDALAELESESEHA